MYRGALYYLVILCTFTISIPATMHKGVSRSTFHRKNTKLIHDWHRCMSHSQTRGEWRAKVCHNADLCPLVSLIILISCIACNRLILSLRGLYYNQMALGPANSGTQQTEGEYRGTIQIPMPSSTFSGAATSLGVSMLAAHDEENVRTYGGSGDPGIILENLAQGQQDSTGLGGSTAEKGAGV